MGRGSAGRFIRGLSGSQGAWRMDGWMEGGMRDRARGLVPAPGDRGDGTATGLTLWGCPRHLLAGCRETGLKTGELGLLGRRERRAGTARAVTLAPVGNSLKSNRRAQLVSPAPLSCRRIITKTPQFCPGVMGPPLAPGQTLPRAVETGLFSPRILFPAAQRAILAGV